METALAIRHAIALARQFKTGMYAATMPLYRLVSNGAYIVSLELHGLVDAVGSRGPALTDLRCRTYGVRTRFADSNATVAEPNIGQSRTLVWEDGGVCSSQPGQCCRYPTKTFSLRTETQKSQS